MESDYIEQFIKELDEKTKDMCVYPQGQDFDCWDCGLCRWVFFNRVREELRKEIKQMGVTIESKNYSIDLGYGGFNNLRKKVAELAGKEIGEHYKKLDKGIFLSGKEKELFFDEYNKKISELEEKFKIPHGILDFLYASDCNGKISYSKCKQIYKTIKEYDDNILYGYCGRKDCTMFKDFKKIVKDCIDSKCRMQWF